jgi:ubiquinone/menaquinone biosynthesis C-methylase UbiE
MGQTPDSGASAHEEFERRSWGEMPDTYDSYFGRITAQAADALLSAVEIKRGARLLEVACGTGKISSSASKAGAEVIGIDFVDGMVAKAKHLHPSIDFRIGDAQALEFDDDTFDAVVCNFAVHHFAEPLRALNEAYRVIRTGGCYAFTVWSPPSDVNVNFRQIIREAVHKHADVKDALPPGPAESYFASPENCLNVLESVGFADISTSEIPLVGRWTRPEEVLGTIYHAMIRSKTLIEAQSASAKQNIEAEIVDRARELSGSGTVEIPMPAMLTRATKK